MTATRSSGAARPSEGHVDVEGGHLAYWSTGQGSPILLIHEAIGDHRMWERETSIHSADHRVVTFDYRGYGGTPPARGPFSYVQDLVDLIAKLRLERPFVVGASMGGAQAIDLALEHPESVRGLLLVAPGLSGGFEPPFEPDEQAAFALDEKRSTEISEAWSKGERERAIELLRALWCSALQGTSVDLFRRMVAENAAEVFDDRSAKLARRAPPAAARLGSVRVPTTVIVGERDNPSSIPFARRIARGIPGSRLLTIPGADHMLNLSRPDAFDSALRDAIARSR